MKNITRVFFDTEFTGLHQSTSLISIGFVADSGKKLYAELTDYDRSQVNPWLEENVIANLLHKDGVEGDTVYITGSKLEVEPKIRNWLDQFEKVEFVADVPHYDFVLLIDLVYGDAMNMPYMSHGSAVYDVNIDIARKLGITCLEAFDVNRENFLQELGGALPQGAKHNALYDAEVCKALYEALR